MIYHKTEYRERRNHFAYFACSEPLAGFDTQRENFLGAYRDWHEPIVVEKGESTNSIAHGWQPIGSHHIRLDLQPNETRTVIFVLGYHENPRDQKFDPPDSQTINKRTVKPIIDYYLNAEHVDEAFDALRAYWNERLGVLQVTTPDEHTNRMVNIWNAYQCMITFNLSRSASYFESGIGRGMGFRDSNQDLLGFVHMVPTRARQRILDLAATQLESGGAYHQYQPLTKRGNNDCRRQLQRRSGVADSGRVRLLERDRRLEHPQRAGALRQQAATRSSRCTNTCSAVSATRSIGWGRTVCR